MGKPPWLPGRALSEANYSAVELSQKADSLFLLDQRQLPEREHYMVVATVADVADAIRQMVVRGAPAIGIAAAYGMVLAAREALNLDMPAYMQALVQSAHTLTSARPTAVNLAWAVRKVLDAATEDQGLGGVERIEHLANVARTIHREDVAACRQMGRVGAMRIPSNATVLTHCNAGALATGGYGSALGVIRAAVEQGKHIHVLADETRPYLQGARLTAWELHQDHIPVEVISDSMAAWFMSRKEVQAVVVGADRIARNGDVANKIGTYGLACLAHCHGVPFYVAAPWSTIDLETPNGDAIPIEQRSQQEMTMVSGMRIVPDGVSARHPAFDVTPARLITAIFTERGELSPHQLDQAAR